MPRNRNPIFVATGLVLLMLFSTTLFHFAQLTPSFEPHSAPASGSTTTFDNGNSSIDLRPGFNESAFVAHEQGTRVTGATVDVTGRPVENWENDSFNASSPMFANGTFDRTVLGSNGIELATYAIAGNGSVPGVGTQNLTVLNVTTWNGTYAFDVLRVQCGIIAPCGTIIADGPLTIIANEIVIAQGGSITADGNTWGGTGRGSNGMYGYTTPMGARRR